MSQIAQRRFIIGAETLPQGGVDFRIWAPGKQHMELVLCDQLGRQRTAIAMSPAEDDYFTACVEEAGAGDLYGFRVDRRPAILPDPASRFQPQGPAGLSQVVDPRQFSWSDSAWKGTPREGQVIYEMHIGTFTAEGVYASAAEQLAELADLGVTVIELMPLADFPGRFGWGYDGVCFFAPTRLYGGPDDLRRFIDRAHGLGLGVILDVVYNHAGPVDQSLAAFSDYYFSTNYKTDWGGAFNYDGEHSAEVRNFVLANAAYWIEEYHFDGLRLDATQNIFDCSEEHIVSALARQVRASATGRATLIVAENEPQDGRLVRPPEQGGFGIDALWNDDFHHAARVMLSGRAEAYYTGYRGSPQEFISAVKYGYLYQGQWYPWQKKHRGSPCLDLPPAAFVSYLQNHDQVANSIRGERAHAYANAGAIARRPRCCFWAPPRRCFSRARSSPVRGRFATSATFIPPKASSRAKAGHNSSPSSPAWSRPHRRRFCPIRAIRPRSRTPSSTSPNATTHQGIYLLHRDLLRLRRDDPVFHRPRRGAIDGAVLGPAGFALRYCGGADGDRLLLLNFGADSAP